MDFQVGKGSYVEIDGSAADLSFGGTESFTITAWINPRTGGVAVSQFNGGFIGAYTSIQFS
jgi:hypothetical protein